MKYPIVAAIVMVSSATNAQVKDDIANDVKSCRSITDGESRLLCYDQIADTMTEREAQLAVETERAVAVAKEVAEQNFGLREDQQSAEIETKTQITAQTKAILKAAQDPDEISAEITKVGRSPSGKKLVYLSNGQVWIETTASKLRNEPKVGETAVVKKAGFGWFRMRFSETYGIMAAKRAK